VNILPLFLALTVPALAQVIPQIEPIIEVEAPGLPSSNLPFSADFDGDGDPDLILDSSFNDRIALLSNDGSGTFSESEIELITTS